MSDWNFDPPSPRKYRFSVGEIAIIKHNVRRFGGNGMTFKREERYIVLKRTDVNKYVPPWLARMLDDIAYSIYEGRLKDGRSPELNSVVVEADWPEYEPVWAMIQRRVEAEQLKEDGSPQGEFQYTGSHEGSMSISAQPQNLPFDADEPYRIMAQLTGLGSED